MLDTLSNISLSEFYPENLVINLNYSDTAP